MKPLPKAMRNSPMKRKEVKSLWAGWRANIMEPEKIITRPKIVLFAPPTRSIGFPEKALEREAIIAKEAAKNMETFFEA